MSTQNDVIWTVTIDSVPLGQVQLGAGGEVSATSHKAWNGGIGETERGGRKTTTNITLRRENDGNPTVPWLEGKINKPARVHRTPRDADGNARMSEQLARAGRLLAVRLDDTDTMNDGDIEMWEIEVGLDT